jgi:drug/metabolite transporter (DMT)-like permease
MIAAFLTTILFSISAVSASHTARSIGGMDANFWRLVCATLFLGCLAHGMGAGLSGGGFTTFFISGCIGFGVGDLALFQALPRLGSRLSILLVQCLAAPVAAIVEWLWLGTRLTLLQTLLSAVVLAGVGAALTPSSRAAAKAGASGTAAGVVFGVIAAVAQALGAVLSRVAFDQVQRAGGSVDGVSAAYQRILGGICVVALLVVVGGRRWFARAGGEAGSSPARWLTFPPRALWPWILLNALAGPALGVSCYQWALKTAPTGIVLPVVATTPVVIIPFARYIEGERPSRRSLLGGLLAVVGAVALALVTTAPRSR